MTNKDKVPTTIEGMIIKIAFGNINTLKNLLREHGGHKADCVWHEGQYEVEGGEFPKTGRRCDCGWAEIDEELKKDNS